MFPTSLRVCGCFPARRISPAVKGAKDVDAAIAANVKKQMEQLNVGNGSAGIHAVGGSRGQPRLLHAEVLKSAPLNRPMSRCPATQVSPVLSGLVKEGKLKIVGGVYDLATGKVTEIGSDAPKEEPKAASKGFFSWLFGGK